MNPRPPLACTCGQHIVLKDILQKGRFFRLSGPGFMYVKYRCPRCKRVGERFVPPEHWDEGALREIPMETSKEERARFAQMGPIPVDEVIDFHFSLEDAALPKALQDAE